MSEAVSARRVHTREKLVDAAIAVFAEKGVLGASVEEICEAAGFTRGAFYSNFDSKDALCLAILDHLAAGHLAATQEAVASVRTSASDVVDLDEVVGRAIGVFLGSQRGDRQSILAGVELRLYAVRSESLRPGYLAFFDRVSSEFVAVLKQTASEFGYRLTVPGPQALAVLQGVYEQGGIAGLLNGRPEGSPDRAVLLGGVLKSMLAPV